MNRGRPGATRSSCWFSNFFVFFKKIKKQKQEGKPWKHRRSCKSQHWGHQWGQQQGSKTQLSKHWTLVSSSDSNQPLSTDVVKPPTIILSSHKGAYRTSTHHIVGPLHARCLRVLLVAASNTPPPQWKPFPPSVNRYRAYLLYLKNILAHFSHTPLQASG